VSLRPLASGTDRLTDPDHEVEFYDPPKQASWLNEVESWLSLLVRQLLRCGGFSSAGEVRAELLAFVQCVNRTMPNPFTWTCPGKPPEA
jgi:hypothetical protein